MTLENVSEQPGGDGQQTAKVLQRAADVFIKLVQEQGYGQQTSEAHSGCFPMPRAGNTSTESSGGVKAGEKFPAPENTGAQSTWHQEGGCFPMPRAGNTESSGGVKADEKYIHVPLNEAPQTSSRSIWRPEEGGCFPTAVPANTGVTSIPEVPLKNLKEVLTGNPPIPEVPWRNLKEVLQNGKQSAAKDEFLPDLKIDYTKLGNEIPNDKAFINRDPHETGRDFPTVVELSNKTMIRLTDILSRGKVDDYVKDVFAKVYKEGGNTGVDHLVKQLQEKLGARYELSHQAPGPKSWVSNNEVFLMDKVEGKCVGSIWLGDTRAEDNPTHPMAGDNLPHPLPSGEGVTTGREVPGDNGPHPLPSGGGVTPRREVPGDNGRVPSSRPNPW